MPRGEYKNWSEEFKEKSRKSWVRSHLKRMGWTPETAAAAKEVQSHACAICGGVVPIFPDHNHTFPTKPRGMLCRPCNSAIGMLQESPKICEQAAAYLRHWNKSCGNCGGCLDCLREERTAGL